MIYASGQTDIQTRSSQYFAPIPGTKLTRAQPLLRRATMGALKSRELTMREWTSRHEEAGVDNAGVAKHEQRGGMSRNHTKERQQLNAPVTHAPALSVDYKSKHCFTR